VQSSSVASDVSYVILYPSVVEARLGTRLRDLDLPVLVLHSRMLDEMGMAAVGGLSTLATQTTVVRPMHSLSAALSGTLTVNKAEVETGYAQPAPAADVVTQLAAGEATEFAYRRGTRWRPGTRRPAGCSSAATTRRSSTPPRAGCCSREPPPTRP
jgi:hypothetical protein